MTLVIDSSAIIALAMTDEDASYAERVLSELASDEAVAPFLFWFEIRNVLIVGERRGRIQPDDTDRFLRKLNRLPISLDTDPHEPDVLAFSRRHHLSVYDAGYLELVTRTEGTLATLDDKLRDAAVAEGVSVIEAA